jgi:hypothetical protein
VKRPAAENVETVSGADGATGRKPESETPEKDPAEVEELG